MDKQFFSDQIALLELDYRTDMPVEEKRSWWSEFQNAKPEHFAEAINRLRRGDGRPESALPFMPKKPEVVRALEGSAHRDALETWTGLMNCIRSGLIETAKIGPKTRYAIDACGGIRKLQYMGDDETPWVKKEFIEAFEAYASAPVVPMIDQRIQERLK